MKNHINKVYYTPYQLKLPPIIEKIIEISPYSEGFFRTFGVVYNGTKIKLTILGKTVAKP